MKAVQVLFDEELLQRLDADQEVRSQGRSAVLRRAAADYLERRRRQRVAEQYCRAYVQGPAISDELEGWEDEGIWPPG